MQLIVGDIVDWPLHQKDPAGPGEMYRRLAAAEDEIYADGPAYALRMCAADAVDCLQLDVTRCGGITGWLRATAIADAFGLQVSGHCAPSLHLAPALATPNLRHVELFADHERLEPMLFDGLPDVAGGALHPTGGPGNGMALASRAEQYRTG